MRAYLASICLAVSLSSFGLAQQPAIKKPVGNGSADADRSANASGDAKLKDLLESKIRAEWDALKKKDAKAYGELLADDYEGVEVDGQGERTKAQAINEVCKWQCLRLHILGLQASFIDPGPGICRLRDHDEIPAKIGRAFLAGIYRRTLGKAQRRMERVALPGNPH